MKNPQILCIDFGSAYTKVALRSAWAVSTELVRDVPIAPKESSFCVPSVVARVESKGIVRWAVGEAAAGQLPGKGVTVFLDLKARLLAQAGAPDPDYDQVGVMFFKGLKDALSKLSLPTKLDGCPARICIPRFEKNAKSRKRLLNILSSAGWDLAEGSETLYEPEANAVGVFTRGRNAVWTPRRVMSSDKTPHYGRMFDPEGVINAFRKAGRGQQVRYGVLVIDVGAFTTDFGYIVFDESFYDNEKQRPDVVQLSTEIGVRQLDEAVLDIMRPEVQAVVHDMPMSAWESRKRALYSGQEAAIRNPKGGMLVIGKGAEAKTIAGAIKEFAKQVVQAKSDFCSDRVDGQIDAVVLTGGGTMVPLVRKALVKAMKTSPGCQFVDLMDENRPPHVHLWRDGTWGWYDDGVEIERALKLNHELARGGSAMGGCSVFYE